MARRAPSRGAHPALPTARVHALTAMAVLALLIAVLAPGIGSAGSAGAAVTAPTRAPAAAVAPGATATPATSALTAPTGRPPALSARSAILVELSTDDVLFELDADRERPIASLTKLMTAYVTLERHEGALDEKIDASDYRPAAIESQMGLLPGDRLSLADMLRGLLLESANDAAVALSEADGSERAFVTEMNRRAKALGLQHTSFANPIGLDDEDNFSSARDLVKLTEALRRSSFFRRTVDRPDATLTSGGRTFSITNRNPLLSRAGWVDGVKTGHTSEAGYTMVASGTRDGVALVAVVLGTPSEQARADDAYALLRWGQRQVVRRTAVRRDAVMARVPIRFRGGARLALTAARSARRVVRRGERLTVAVSGVPTRVEGPIPRGTRLGWADVSEDGRRVVRVPLVAASSVGAATTVERVRDALSGPLGVVALGAIVLALATVLSVLARDRARRRRRRARRRPVGAA